MTIRRLVLALAAKELREIAPVCAGGLCAVGLYAVANAGWVGLGWVLYPLFSLGLGAVSAGHEHRYRTFQGLLAQPVSRLTVLTVKMGILAVMLGVLVGAGWLVTAGRGDAIQPALLIVPAATALFLAPWLTLVCRSELAGMVFAAAVPAMFWIAGQLAAVVEYGLVSPEPREAMATLRWSIFLPAFVVACAVGALGTVRAFLRLEVTGEPGGDPLVFPKWGRQHRKSAPAPTLTRVQPFWSLVKKELHLYTLPFVVAALFAVLWVLTGTVGGSWVTLVDIDALQRILSGFYLGVTVVLVGAILSAEERQMGTLPAQLLVPVSGKVQWAVKVACALGVTILLVVVVPASLMVALPGPSGAFSVLQFTRVMIGLRSLEATVAVALTLAVSVYVSSLCLGATRAFLLAIGAAIVTSFGVGIAVAVPMRRFLRQLGEHIDVDQLAWVPEVSGTVGRFGTRWLPLLLGAGVVTLAFRYAKRNHLSLDRTRRAVAGQVVRLALAVVVAIGIQVLVSGLIQMRWQMQFQKQRQTQAEPQARQPAEPTSTAAPAPTAPR